MRGLVAGSQMSLPAAPAGVGDNDFHVRYVCVCSLGPTPVVSTWTEDGTAHNVEVVVLFVMGIVSVLVLSEAFDMHRTVEGALVRSGAL